jgi:uncharacterized membrane protein (DUF485 family)
MNYQESKDITKIVSVCAGIMAIMFLTVYLGNIAILSYLPADFG